MVLGHVTVPEFDLFLGFAAQFSKPFFFQADSSMLRSRTSDLTASVTSADFCVANDCTTEEEDVETSETDGLLLKGTSKPAMVVARNGYGRPAALLNLTHIDDDDISFADSSDDNAVEPPVCRNPRC